MNLKKVFSGCLVLLLVIAVSACGSDGVNGGKICLKDSSNLQLTHPLL